MSVDLIRYEALVLDALRGVVRNVLQRVQKKGMPGDHHFFITFETGAPGVIISKRLKDQYPNEMTIVLQHQFWDLAVYDDRFEVRLSFNNLPERLCIPFSAVRIFRDPSVAFGLALHAPTDEDLRLMAEPAEAADAELLPLLKDDAAQRQETAKPDGEMPAQETETLPGPSDAAKVVSLDKFRKK